MTPAVINPVERIAAARRRLKRVAAVRAGLALFVPALTALLLAATLGVIGAATWERVGYALAPAKLDGLRLALLIAGAAALAGCALMAWRAFREADDFMEAAERVDEAVDGHQEIVTLASLADPAEPPAQRALRTPLFPLLWRRAAAYLERFDPNRAFAFEVRRPLARSLPIAAVMVVILAAAALALVRPPTAEQLQARKLRAAAEQLASSPSSADKELASKILAAAAALENPRLPPQQKLARLAEAMSELQKQQQGSSPQQSAKNASGSGNGKGTSGKGTGQGTAPGQDSGNGQGKGQGQGQGQGEHEGNNPNGPKSKEQIVELRNDLSKAQAQIESGSGSSGNAPKPGQGDKGSALKPGNNPNEKGPSQQPDALAQGNIPRPDTSAKGQTPSGGAKSGKNEKGGHGDTHLGEFPVAENFQRFYQPGQGPPIEIRDARYVLFRLPTEVVSASGGKIVPDTNRPTASVPYANVPLKTERLDATPQERQLVPPRYRDLIH
ncbi:MAG TPA: hypothetical protein VNF49_02705 [Candidatus Binataceae bacterium]|nr:hypothetical protein [Candidatus Binataceae bacterium]